MSANPLVNEVIPPKAVVGGSPAHKLCDLHIDLEKSAGEPESPGASAGILEEIDD